MISEVKGTRLLRGFRGRPAADTDALAQTLVNVSANEYPTNRRLKMVPRRRAIHRSVLTMQINNPRFVNAAWTRGCDGFTLDFEDSVPQAQKAHARTLVQHAIQTAGQGGGEVVVRINQAFIEADVVAAVWPGLSGLNMGHTLTVEQVNLMDEWVTRMERERASSADGISVACTPMSSSQ